MGGKLKIYILFCTFADFQKNPVKYNTLCKLFLCEHVNFQKIM